MKTSWQDNDCLEKEFTFQNFSDAMIFVNKVAEITEEMNHHPEIIIHDYNKVTIKTITHSEGKITKKDHELAEKVDDITY